MEEVLVLSLLAAALLPALLAPLPLGTVCSGGQPGTPATHPDRPQQTLCGVPAPDGQGPAGGEQRPDDACDCQADHAAHQPAADGRRPYRPDPSPPPGTPPPAV